MRAFVKNNEHLSDVDLTSFEHEEDLESLIFNNPDLLPIDKLTGEDGDFIPVSKQLQTDHGPLDILGIDTSGNIFIIENKLDKNSTTDVVRNQLHDYASALCRLDFDEFKKRISENNKREKLQSFSSIYGKSLNDILDENFKGDDRAAIERDINKNLLSGSFVFIIGTNLIADRLRHNIEYEIKQCSRPLFALGISSFTQKDQQFIMTELYPNSIGDYGGQSQRGPRQTEENFMKQLEKSSLTADKKRHIKDVIEKCTTMIKDVSGRIDWGSGDSAKFLPKFPIMENARAPFNIKPWGNLRLQLQMMVNSYPELHNQFLTELEKIDDFREIINKQKKGKVGIDIPLEKWESHSDQFLNIILRVFGKHVD